MGFLDFILNRNSKLSDAKVDQQSLEKTNIIRLTYIALETFRADTALGVTTIQSSPFIIPEGMTNDEACKVVSYLSELVEQRDEIDEASKQSVSQVSSILSDYGFTKIKMQPHGYSHAIYNYDEWRSKPNISNFYNDMKGVTDLFTVDGNFELFKQSNLYGKYFNWFSKNVSQEEVEKIYSRIGLEFPDCGNDTINNL